MTTKAPGFEKFAERRDRLVACMTALANAYDRLGAKPRADELRKSRQRLESEVFRLMVVGEFKRGKSTLINAMLGRDILPAKVAPCTAVITRICFAEREKAVLYFKDPAQTPVEIPVAELKAYVTIQNAADVDDDEDAASEAVDRNPYDRAEVFYPLPLLRNNVEVIDSPGLNEHKSRTKVALEFLEHADAMIVVLSCQQALSQSELEFVREDLKGRDLRDVFFLWNHYDIVRDSPDDFADIQDRSRKYLEPKVGARQRIFFVSARLGLLGRKDRKPEALAASNLPAFETALEAFLSVERGRVKLAGPLRTAESAVRDGVLQLLPERESLLKQPLELLQKKLGEQRPRLAEAEQQRERMLKSINRRAGALAREAEASYRNLVAELRAGLPAQAAAVDISVLHSIKSRADVKKQLANGLQVWMRQQVTEWQETKLKILLDAHIGTMATDLDEQARSLLANLQTVRTAFAPEVSVPLDADGENVSALSRVVGAAGGFVIGGIGSAMEGASLGVTHMAKGLAVHVGVVFGLVVLGAGLPVILPVLAAVGILRTLLGAKGNIERLREETVKAVVAALVSKQGEVEKELRGQLITQFKKLFEAVSSGLNIKIDEVKGQIQTVVRERQSHENAASQGLELLNLTRQELVGQDHQLQQLRAELESA